VELVKGTFAGKEAFVGVGATLLAGDYAVRAVAEGVCGVLGVGPVDNKVSHVTDSVDIVVSSLTDRPGVVIRHLAHSSNTNVMPDGVLHLQGLVESVGCEADVVLVCNGEHAAEASGEDCCRGP
jgi:hypothetical protein